MEKTVTIVTDCERTAPNARDAAAKACALPEAPLPMPLQNLSPADAPWLSVTRVPRPPLLVQP
ncbi:hypothetical protein [Roseicitreum antarcticum]|uniref:Uncharacterized protein n=1 Tax=Roseicitreum antarcticum TaxID=564137 RepID=A0A1H2TR22_9RHOB|nr:hypothetical protein [Roseicitreum antarcticum]SDW46340.1 hypothetical protein SAMN04488238_102144 [Roseicitreum antarcticum]